MNGNVFTILNTSCLSEVSVSLTDSEVRISKFDIIRWSYINYFVTENRYPGGTDSAVDVNAVILTKVANRV